MTSPIRVHIPADATAAVRAEAEAIRDLAQALHDANPERPRMWAVQEALRQRATTHDQGGEQ